MVRTVCPYGKKFVLLKIIFLDSPSKMEQKGFFLKKKIVISQLVFVDRKYFWKQLFLLKLSFFEFPIKNGTKNMFSWKTNLFLNLFITKLGNRKISEFFYEIKLFVPFLIRNPKMIKNVILANGVNGARLYPHLY